VTRLGGAGLLALCIALAGSAAGCDRTTPAPAAPAARPMLTAKQIAEASKPAIVRVEAGDDRVGTGFVVDAHGVIATNLHVVAGLASIRVRLLDGAVLPVRAVAAVDPERDLVLLTIEPAALLPVVTLGSSQGLASGDPVVAIGNPLGVLDYSVSDGLISSIREVSPTLSVLQISAPISQGSSGGPLFDMYGDVIGVTQSIFTGGQNLNFAIPADYVRALVEARGASLSLMEFATRTTPVADGAAPRIARQVPQHDLSLVAGCPVASLAEAVALVQRTIALGAPLYNQGDHEACARAYADTAQALATRSACPGLRGAFADGLTRSAALASFTEQAWALRDTFDGVLDVIARSAAAATPAP
jgi:serine protease Do